MCNKNHSVLNVIYDKHQNILMANLASWDYEKAENELCGRKQILIINIHYFMLNEDKTPLIQILE